MAFFSPMDYKISAIASYSADILPILEENFDIDIFTDYPNTNGKNDIYPVEKFEEYVGNYDTILYQIGNHPCFDSTYGTLLKHKGIVEFHEVKIEGVYSEKPLLSSSCREALGMATKVIVHTNEALSEIIELDPHAEVTVIPHFTDIDVKGPSINEICEDKETVYMFGRITKEKNYEEIIRRLFTSGAFGEINLCIAGFEEDPKYLGNLKNIVKEFDITSCVKFEVNLSKERYRELLREANLCLMSRPETRGEESRVMLDNVVNNIVNIVVLGDHFGSLPDESVIVLDNTDMRRSLLKVAYSHKVRERTLSIARRNLQLKHGRDNVARLYNSCLTLK